MKIIDLKVKDEFEIIGRGKVFVVDPDENNISLKRNDDLIMKQIFRYNNNLYQVKGIEAFVLSGDYRGDIGLLVNCIFDYDKIVGSIPEENLLPNSDWSNLDKLKQWMNEI